MDATSRDVAQNVEIASQRAADADKEVDQVQDVIVRTSQTVGRLSDQITESATVIGSLNESVGNINSVLGVIQGIAEQTNLLALNAAIEAARAGEQGRGFAVVADEVRNLAAKTQGSTEEIRAMIEGLKSNASKAVSVMNASRSISDETIDQARQAEQTLARIGELIRSLSEMNHQIAAAAEEQSATTGSVNESIVEIQQIAENTSRQMAETRSTSQSLAAVGAELQRQVGHYRV
jgi:methyl-accepting chemotaxis protein